MTETFAAVVSSAHGAFEIRQVTLDELRRDEVLVEIVATGICHTDLAVRDRDLPFPELPAVLGHEGAGKVIAIGDAVKSVAPGDHVVLSFAYCGECQPCSSGMPAQCHYFFPLNMGGCRSDGSFVHSMDGKPVNGSFFGQSSFAREAVVSERNLVKVPKDVPLEILGPLGCAIQTGAGTVLNTLKPVAGASLVVFGAGAVGLSAVMAAKIAACAKIIVVDLVDARLSLARELGATDTINARNASVADTIRGLTNGEGADHIIEASGAGPAMEAAFLAVKMGGTISVVGVPLAGTMISIPFASLMSTQVTTVTEGDSNPAEFIPQMIDHYRAGRLPFDRLIRFYDFSQINEAAQDGEAGVTIKPVLRMTKEA